MSAGSSEDQPRFGSGWLPGLFLGALNGIALLSLGTIGLPFLALTLLLILWKGPRFRALAGLLTGAGLIWTVLFARVALSCVFAAQLPGESCGSPGIGAWVAIAAVTFGVGLGASVVAFRRARRRG